MTVPHEFEPDKGSGHPQYGQPHPYGAPQPWAPQYGASQYGAPHGTPPMLKPDDYLVWAILATVMCCLPLGIVSIVKSTSVSKLWAVGDFAGARKASEDARTYAIWSAVASVILVVVSVIAYAVLFVILASAGSSTSTTY
ncbi:hypothetical protein nbrc107696_16250 [Gordonia spumicola]|uniref:Interferon-induced transmembrane protein n=1 Tax=Gordonia spumicola TaxID=589161 RepID=A0A7I9V6Z0_9ACTN|nr:CD225/dispanin family protein [Gordonia spumicola]GEE01179.1 hypothetical protein nbrc107696_16250 [Gordonia spumicola]